MRICHFSLAQKEFVELCDNLAADLIRGSASPKKRALKSSSTLKSSAAKTTKNVSFQDVTNSEPAAPATVPQATTKLTRSAAKRSATSVENAATATAQATTKQTRSAAKHSATDDENAATATAQAMTKRMRSAAERSATNDENVHEDNGSIFGVIAKEASTNSCC